MMRTPTRLRLCITLIVCNLIFIWGNSLLPGEISGALSDWLKDLLAPLFGWEDEGGGQGGLLRKVAHFTEFAALGVCFRWLWGMLSTKRSAQVLIPLGSAIAVACIDETIQIFSERGSSVTDVWIDGLGYLIAAIVVTVLYGFVSLIGKICKR